MSHSFYVYCDGLHKMAYKAISFEKITSFYKQKCYSKNTLKKWNLTFTNYMFAQIQINFLQNLIDCLEKNSNVDLTTIDILCRSRLKLLKKSYIKLWPNLNFLNKKKIWFIYIFLDSIYVIVLIFFFRKDADVIENFFVL